MRSAGWPAQRRAGASLQLPCHTAFHLTGQSNSGPRLPLATCALRPDGEGRLLTPDLRRVGRAERIWNGVDRCRRLRPTHSHGRRWPSSADRHRPRVPAAHTAHRSSNRSSPTPARTSRVAGALRAVIASTTPGPAATGTCAGHLSSGQAEYLTRTCFNNRVSHSPRPCYGCARDPGQIPT